MSYDTSGNPTVTSRLMASGQGQTTRSTALGNADCASTAIASSTCQTSGGPVPLRPAG